MMAAQVARAAQRITSFGPDFEAKMDAMTASRARPGNRTEMLFDGKASFSARQAMIMGAHSTIHLQTYIFSSDETGWQTARMLAARARDGIAVRVIYDATGSKDTDPAIFEYMRRAGVEVRELGKRWPWQRMNARWHEKSLIVDGRAAIQGGMNIADEYSSSGGSWLPWRSHSSGWHDTDMRVVGPAVEDTQRDFFRNWATLGTPLNEAQMREALPPRPVYPNGASVRVVQNRPYENQQHDIEDTYFLAISEARTSITIESAYFVPTERIREALMAAARRGVRVRVLTNSAHASDVPIESYVGRYWYRELIAAGVEIREMTDRMLHAKTATFDGAYSIVGSANLNHRAMRHDSEDVVGVRDATLANDLERHWESLIPESTAVTKKTLDNDSWWVALLAWFLHFFAHFM